MHLSYILDCPIWSGIEFGWKNPGKTIGTAFKGVGQAAGELHVSEAVEFALFVAPFVL